MLTNHNTRTARTGLAVVVANVLRPGWPMRAVKRG